MNKTNVRKILLSIGVCLAVCLVSVMITYQITSSQFSSQLADVLATQKDLNNQTLMGVLWIQQSGEYDALCYQAFNTAKLMYDLDLTKPSTLPRAVIVDIDETILNNMPEQAAYIGTENSYPIGWSEWVNAAQAKPLPGAVEFLNYVASTGGEVFYITNRGPADHDGTIANLNRFGFPMADDTHLKLAINTSDKEQRRQEVAATHRIVLLMGDNLNDLSDDFYLKSPDERKAAVAEQKNLIGVKYFPLPNPVYGDWESAIYNYTSGITPAEKARLRDNHLIRFEY